MKRRRSEHLFNPNPSPQVSNQSLSIYYVYLVCLALKKIVNEDFTLSSAKPRTAPLMCRRLHLTTSLILFLRAALMTPRALQTDSLHLFTIDIIQTNRNL